MKNIVLRSLIIGATSFAPIVSMAGGVDVAPCCQPPRVDIPDMRPGWGFTVEGSALRGYNNNLNYFIVNNSAELLPFGTEDTALNVLNSNFRGIDPVYAFGLRVGVDYTLPGSGNVLKLSYEHLFNRKGTNDSELLFTNLALIPGSPDSGPIFVSGGVEGSVRQKLDGISLVSEQHILIGPYWETTFTGGARFAHIGQEIKDSIVTLEEDSTISGATSFGAFGQFNMQYNGVGPLAGFGTIFHVTDMFALGAEVQGALLMGRNKISSSLNSVIGVYTPDDLITPFVTTFDVYTPHNNSVYSIVPEMYYRIYGNYFYRFNDGSEIQIEAGWRANQFFNLRTFDDLFSDTTPGSLPVNVTASDDIGFSGPYLMFHYKL